MKTAAIFDIDGTVFRDSLLLQHLEKCVDYETMTYFLNKQEPKLR